MNPIQQNDIQTKESTSGSVIETTSASSEPIHVIERNGHYELADEQVVAWYAIKIHHTQVEMFVEYLAKRGVETYVAKDVLASVVFVKAEINEILALRETGAIKGSNKTGRIFSFFVYGDQDTKKPKAIPEEEMRMFVLVTTAGGKDIVDLGADAPFYHEGDRVRVKEGIFQGAEGVIKRIKGNRRLIVAVTGVTAVATAHIPEAFLERI